MTALHFSNNFSLQFYFQIARKVLQKAQSKLQVLNGWMLSESENQFLFDEQEAGTT